LDFAQPHASTNDGKNVTMAILLSVQPEFGDDDDRPSQNQHATDHDHANVGGEKCQRPTGHPLAEIAT